MFNIFKFAALCCICLMIFDTHANKRVNTIDLIESQNLKYAGIPYLALTPKEVQQDVNMVASILTLRSNFICRSQGHHMAVNFEISKADPNSSVLIIDKDFSEGLIETKRHIKYLRTLSMIGVGVGITGLALTSIKAGIIGRSLLAIGKYAGIVKDGYQMSRTTLNVIRGASLITGIGSVALKRHLDKKIQLDNFYHTSAGVFDSISCLDADESVPEEEVLQYAELYLERLTVNQ